MTTKIIALIGAFLILVLAGCAGRTGWQFNIGITPVNEIQDMKVLKQIK